MIKQILVLVLLIGGLIGLYIHGVNEEKNISGIPPIIQQSLIQQLEGKTASEKAKIKSQEIAKLHFQDEYVRGDLRIVIVGNPEWIEVNGQHGIQLFAQAYINGKQLGFGKNGSIDIERFRIFNPPVLVDDDNGDIIREWTDEITGEQKQRKLKQDLEEAVLQSLEHTIKLVGKDDKNIKIGKIGNTTSTFYPDANPESTSVDGWARYYTGSAVSFSTIRSANGTHGYDFNASGSITRLTSYISSGEWIVMHRAIYGFDTSTLPPSDTISSATFSLYGYGVTDNFSQSLVIDRNEPSSPTAITASDYNIGNWDAVEQSSTRIAYSSWNTSGYNDFTLNTTGLGNINKSGVSWFGTRCSADFDNSEPSWQLYTDAYVQAYFADQTGTTNDPKLVVVHSGSGSGSGGWEFFDVQ